LKPQFNLALMGAYAVVIATLIAWSWRSCLPTLVAAIPLGVILGMLQRRAMIANSHQLVSSSTAMDVRRALTASQFGRRYIRVLWISFALLLVTSVATSRATSLLPYLCGLATMWLVREAITLRDTYALAERGVV
jgi:hypothetical protein